MLVEYFNFIRLHFNPNMWLKNNRFNVIKVVILPISVFVKMRHLVK